MQSIRPGEDGPTKGHNLTEVHAAIPDTFRRLCKIDGDIDRQMELHVNHLKEDRKRLMKDLRETTGIEARDLNLFFKIFARQEAAKEMDEEDRLRILDAQAVCFEALAKHETLDFLSVLDTAGGTVATRTRIQQEAGTGGARTGNQQEPATLPVRH